MKKKRFFLYKFFRLLLGPYFKLFYNAKIINKHNLQVDGPIIIAGNHRHAMDQGGAIIASKRVIRYMAKKEYFDGAASLFKMDNRFTRWFSKKIVISSGSIPVDRTIKDEEATLAAIDVLTSGGAIGIFPEGTRNKTEEFLLPFKFGVVSLAKKTNATIIPFGITGDYKFRSKDLKIRFGEPFKIDDMTLEEANDKLYNIVKQLMEENIK